ncbi:MAG: hypothetical protein HY286_13835 [Planctomycetes bacterium]|nr:hypothetical protein [Planctomycetota bacterium]
MRTHKNSKLDRAVAGRRLPARPFWYPIGAALLAAMAAPGFSQESDVAKRLGELREAAKSNDAAKCKEISGALLKANPESLNIRFEIALASELRKDPYVAFAHFAEVAAAGERMIKNKEKLSDEESKAARESTAKTKTMQDAYAQALSKALKTYSDSVLKIARLAKSQKNWKFTCDIMRNVKDLFDHAPGVLDPKDGREQEAAKLLNEASLKKSEDKPENDKQRGDLSEAVAALSADLGKVYESAFATYEEVRGPHARNRALLPVSILVSLNNDPDGNAKKATAVWERALEVEPNKEYKLRLATDAVRFKFVVNGKIIATANNTRELRDFRSESEFTVNLFRESNFISFYGHEIRESGKKQGKQQSDYFSRSWFLLDLIISEKIHFISDPSWESLMKPPSGWDVCPFGCYVIFPVAAIGGTEYWDYEKTKDWKGQTLVGDRVDTYFRRIFDLPAAAPAAPVTPGR